MILIIGTIRLPAENLDAARAPMRAMAKASRAEPGCLTYAYSEDVLDPGLIRINEIWASRDALKAHFTLPHMAAWRASWPALGIGERNLQLYEAGEAEPI